VEVLEVIIANILVITRAVLIMKCVKLVLSMFIDNEVVLNNTYIFLIALLICFMNSVGLGLVMIQLVSSAERINLDVILSLFFIIFGGSMM
jgi:hypothetical protein